MKLLNETVITVYTIKEISDNDLNARIMQQLNTRCYNYCNDLNHIYEVLKSKDSVFQIKFVYNLYDVIGHHDHMEIEAVNANPRLRAEALLLTLNPVDLSAKMG